MKSLCTTFQGHCQLLRYDRQADTPDTNMFLVFVFIPLSHPTSIILKKWILGIYYL